MLWMFMTGSLWSEESGRASAELLLSPARIEADQSIVIPAVIRMVYEKGWHGYWSNPGEGGMKTEVSWTLPEGFKAGELQFPAPTREMTGELACYGYSGEVMLAVELRGAGPWKPGAVISATVNWLACNDTGCVPGEAKVQSTVPAKPEDTTHREKITTAFAILPAKDPALRLDVSESDGWLDLSLTGADHLQLDGAELFPETEQAIDPSSAWHWKKSPTGYSARVKKNEYASGSLQQLVLVVVPKASSRSLRIEWKK